MTSDNVAINSTNFSVDKNGNMSCNNADVIGKITSSDATITGGNIRLIDDTTSSTTSSLSVRKSDGGFWTNIKPHWIMMAGSQSNGSINVYNESNYRIISMSLGTGTNQKSIRHEINSNVAKSRWLLGDNLSEPISESYITPEEIKTPSINTQTIDANTIQANVFEVKNSGKCMYGMNGHLYRCRWQDDGRLHFFVDTTDVANISDERLKTDIKQVDERLIKAIGELDYKQFIKANRNGLVSVGIIAQDLMKAFDKYGINVKDYEIFDEFQYDLEDETLYYRVDYEQFLVLRMMYNEMQIQELKEKDKQKDEVIQDLIKRIEKLEKGE